MREHEVFAAGGENEGVSEVFHGHSGAFDVPAGTTRTKGCIPLMLTGFGRLPQSEVAGRILLVLIYFDARAVGDAVEILLRELAVFGETGDAEIPGAVVGAIGDVLRSEPLDERHHSGGMFGAARDDFGVLDLQRIEVLKKSLLEFAGVVGEGQSF